MSPQTLNIWWKPRRRQIQYPDLALRAQKRWTDPEAVLVMTPTRFLQEKTAFLSSVGRPLVLNSGLLKRRLLDQRNPETKCSNPLAMRRTTEESNMWNSWLIARVPGQRVNTRLTSHQIQGGLMS
jgi:hypothetical protein